MNSAPFGAVDLPATRSSARSITPRIPSLSIPSLLRLQELHDPALALQLPLRRLGVGGIGEHRLEYRNRLIVLAHLVERLRPTEPQARAGAVVLQALVRHFDGAL